MAWDHGSCDIAAGGACRKEELEDERSVKSASGERGGLGMGAGVPGGGGTVEGVLYVKVMTDEQMEVLRKQISVYSTICDQLVEMHKAHTAQEDSIAGMRLGNLYCDPLMTSGSHKLTARQRWTPTPLQLQILESIFDQGNGTPSKQKIKEITSELVNHGQISETNVYNWFQNRRARSKRKQTVALPNNVESEVEVETEVDSPKEKKCKPDKILSLENPSHKVGGASFHSQDICSDMYPLDPELTEVQGNVPLNGGSKSSGSFGQISFYGTVLGNPSVDQLMGNMSGSYSPFHSIDGFDTVG